MFLVRILTFCLVIILVSSCGQKGDLYLSKEAKTQTEDAE